MPGIAARTHQRTNVQAEFDLKPDNCPQCHHAVEPNIGEASLIMEADQNEPGVVLEIIFQCTRRDCFRYFIGTYKKNARNPNNREVMTGSFKLMGTAPLLHVDPIFSEEINTASPNFVKIYSQASVAESIKLDQIAGLGYRKALEFLVKDYCIAEDLPAKAAIEKETLGSTIGNRVSDVNVKACAERAAWLGNDEAHYVRKWEDKDIKDLKTLIQLTSNWIQNSRLTKQYLTDMGKPRQ
jgi:hypothetical protein